MDDGNQVYDRYMVNTFEKKLLVLDIDGTLANSNKRITQSTKDTIIRMMTKGHYCMLASGRPTHGMEWAAKELEFSRFGGYLLSYNGARIIKYDSMETVFEDRVPKELLPELLKFAVAHKCGIISYDGNTIISGNGIDQYIELESRINDLPIKQVTNFADYFDEDVIKCLFCVDPRKAEALATELRHVVGDRADVFRSEPFYIEVMPKGVDKATSISMMLSSICVTQENVVACGDGFNDISMIKFAGIGVAMGNAQQAVKDVADIITGTNDEDGLIPIIERYFDFT